MSLTTEQCYELIHGLLTFPYPQVCRHLVVLNILEYMKQNGVVVDETFEHAVTRAQDDVALADKIWE